MVCESVWLGNNLTKPTPQVADTSQNFSPLWMKSLDFRYHWVNRRCGLRNKVLRSGLSCSRPSLQTASALNRPQNPPALWHLLGMYVTKAPPRFSSYAIIPHLLVTKYRDKYLYHGVQHYQNAILTRPIYELRNATSLLLDKNITRGGQTLCPDKGTYFCTFRW